MEGTNVSPQMQFGYFTAAYGSYLMLANPFEVVQTRMQGFHAISVLGNTKGWKTTLPLEEGKIPSMMDTVRDIKVSQKGIRGFYRGVIPFGMYYIISTGLYYVVSSSKNDPLIQTVPLGIGITLLTNPLLLYRNQYVVSPVFSRTNAQLIKNAILAKNTFLSGAVAFLIVDVMNKFSDASMPESSDSENLDAKAFGIPFGLLLLTSIFSYPLETIAVNQQILALDHKEGIINMSKQIYAKRGWRGFFAGFSVSLLTIIPATISSGAALAYIFFNTEIKDNKNDI